MPLAVVLVCRLDICSEYIFVRSPTNTRGVMPLHSSVVIIWRSYDRNRKYLAYRNAKEYLISDGPIWILISDGPILNFNFRKTFFNPNPNLPL